MLISPAHAQAVDAAAGGIQSGLLQILPLVLIFAVFYFLLIRPQQKRMKAHREMLANVRRGDVVVTSGGIIGTVTKVMDTELQVEIAEGVKVKVSREMLASVNAKAEPSKSTREKEENREDA